MEDKVPKFLTKLIMVPFIFFTMYALIFILGIQILGEMETQDNSIWILAGAILLANLIAFFITLGIYLIFIKFWGETVFRRWYHYTHLLFIYVSGVASAIISLESLLLKDKIITSPIDDNTKLVMIIFVIIISNYTFFNSIILNDEFQIKNKLIDSIQQHKKEK